MSGASGVSHENSVFEHFTESFPPQSAWDSDDAWDRGHDLGEAVSARANDGFTMGALGSLPLFLSPKIRGAVASSLMRSEAFGPRLAPVAGVVLGATAVGLVGGIGGTMLGLGEAALDS